MQDTSPELLTSSPNYFCCVFFYSSSWRRVFPYVLAGNVLTLTWQVLSYVFRFSSFLNPKPTSSIGHLLLPASSRRAGQSGFSAGFWLCWQRAAGSGAWLCFWPGFPSPRCNPALPPGPTVPVAAFLVPLEPLFRTQVMPPSSWLVVMVGTPCPSADGPKEGQSRTAGG